MTRLHTFFLALCVLLAGVTANGAESESGAEQSGQQSGEKQTQESKKAADAKKQQSGNKTKDKEIFIPSEEISEDFAVSFPVDI